MYSDVSLGMLNVLFLSLDIFPDSLDISSDALEALDYKAPPPSELALSPTPAPHTPVPPL